MGIPRLTAIRASMDGGITLAHSKAEAVLGFFKARRIMYQLVFLMTAATPRSCCRIHLVDCECVTRRSDYIRNWSVQSYTVPA